MPRAAGSILVALVAALVLPDIGDGGAGRTPHGNVNTGVLRRASIEAGSAYVNAWLSESGETFADLGFWAAPAEPGESPVTWTGWSNDELISIDDSTLEVTFGVYSTDGDSEEPSALKFIGDATLAAVLTPAGEPETFRANDQLGNNHSARAALGSATTSLAASRCRMPSRSISPAVTSSEAPSAGSATARPTQSRTPPSSNSRAGGRSRMGTPRSLR